MMLKRNRRYFFLLLLLAAAVLFIGLYRRSPAGAWHGFATGEGGTYRVSMVVDKLIDGIFFAGVNSLDANYQNNFNHVSVNGHSVHGEDVSGTSFDLKMDWSGRSLSGRYTMGSKTLNLSLKRGKDFIVPCVNFSGDAAADYSYQVPRTAADGLETADLQSNGGDLQKIEGAVHGILDLTYPGIHGLLVSRHGKLVLEEYFYGYGPGDEHTMQSTTKSVLSILFGIAQDQGLVHVQDKLYDYFPEYRNKLGWSADKNKITLGNLLSMTSGYACDDFYPATDCHFEMFKSPDWLDFTLSQPMNHKPGEHWAYCNDCMELLGAVIARKSGMPVPDFAKKYLFEPLGIDAESWGTGPHQVTEMCGSLWLKPRDMVKLGYLYLKNGNWNGKQVVSRDWVLESTKPQAITPHDKPRTFDEGYFQTFDYGYLWWMKDMPYKGRTVRVFYSAGRGDQYIFVVPELDLVCAVTGGNFNDMNPGLDLFKDRVLGAFE